MSRSHAKRDGFAACAATAEYLVTTLADKCQMCGVPEAELLKSLCLDHDHETGAFRGWLCHGCNWAVGVVEARGHLVTKYLNRRYCEGAT